MKLHVTIPFSDDKELAKEYNCAMSKIENEDWMVFVDHDVLFLTPQTIKNIHGYIDRFPNTGIFTCLTNRAHNLSKEQLYLSTINNNDNIKHHLNIALDMERNLFKVTRLKEVHRFSGFLMVIKKETWNKVNFNEQRKCLWVDTDFAQAINKAGMNILRMDGVYVWHTYRLYKHELDKTHLE